VEIAENSENHLKAIADERQMAEVIRVSEGAGNVVKKPQGEGKASENAWNGAGTPLCRVLIGQEVQEFAS
jgi:hypothetical protein